MLNTIHESPKKLFILVRRDLSHGQRIVQACHALAELMRKQGHDPQLREWADEHKTLVILGVLNLAELLRWEQKLRDSLTKYEVFMEPDKRDEKTAIAVHPSADACLFRKLQLI